MAVRTGFTFSYGGIPEGEARRSSGEQPLRILIMGDFSGTGGAEGAGGGALDGSGPLRVTAIDVDNLDQVMSALEPRLSTAAAGDGVLRFRCIDDFHPDELSGRLPRLAELGALRRRLLDSDTFESAAAELRAQHGLVPDADDSKAGGPIAEKAGESDADTLERLLGQPAGSGRAPAAASAADEFIRNLVARHVVADKPHRQAYLDAVDTLAADIMRSLLHDPRFQSLEALWRGIHRLVSNLETDETLQLGLLDVSKQALQADLAADGQDPLHSTFGRRMARLNHEGVGGGAWSLIVGCYEFDASAQDLGLLTVLGTVAGGIGVPFLAAASPRLAGFPDLLAASGPSDWVAPALPEWQALRASEQGHWIGLASPRVLLRLPYGDAGEVCDVFRFEEMPGVPEHGALLWGSPALACAQAVGLAFREGGWSRDLVVAGDLADLPALTYTRDGESALYPCAERFLGERAGQSLYDGGCICVLSHKNRNAVRVAPLRSVHADGRLLPVGSAVR